MRSLREFYGELPDPGDDPSVILGGRLMLELIPNIEQVCVEINAWALTSHANLVLVAHDDYTSPWFIRA
jgi:hypothetical protein